MKRRRITLQDIPAHCLPPEERARTARAKPSKYRNVRTTVDGVTFPSKHHARHHQCLQLRKNSGEIEDFIPEVSIPIGGGRRMQLDYLIIPRGTRLVFEDPKGFATREWLLKRDIAQGLYSIEIRMV